MINENGAWIMQGMAISDPHRIRTWQALVDRINEIGFLPLFANEIPGFSAEEHVAAKYWWSGDRTQDPWEWREIISASRTAAYGKFFDKKAGFISLRWLPYFANFRRGGYDFDAAWEDAKITRREKLIMDVLTDTDAAGEVIWKDTQILSTELKKLAGFGKGGEKNYPGVATELMMKLYLVTADFHRRRNQSGGEYGMPVSVLLPPEAVWGYDAVTAAYDEEPAVSWQRIHDQILVHFPHAEETAIRRLIGKCPA